MRNLLFAVILLITGAAFLARSADAEDFMGIPILAEQGEETYARDLYKHWIDADGDDEDTRQEVLIDESLIPAQVQEKPDGTRFVTSGLWVGVYTGRVTTNPGDLDIDHMIPLKEVHISGGHGWDEDRRRDYANDLDHSQTLIAVAKGANRSKGDRDPASWMPPNRSYWCKYLEDWVSVKRKWELAMDADEAAAVQEGIRVCGRYKSGDRLQGRH